MLDKWGCLPLICWLLSWQSGEWVSHFNLLLVWWWGRLRSDTTLFYFSFLCPPPPPFYIPHLRVSRCVPYFVGPPKNNVSLWIISIILYPMILFVEILYVYYVFILHLWFVGLLQIDSILDILSDTPPPPPWSSATSFSVWIVCIV